MFYNLFYNENVCAFETLSYQLLIGNTIEADMAHMIVAHTIGMDDCYDSMTN